MRTNWIKTTIIALALGSSGTTPLFAQQGENEVIMPGEAPKPTKYIAVEEQKQHLVLFQGFTISGDLYGPIAYAVSDYGWAEGALRLNLKNTFFPIVEAGFGRCSKEDFNTKINYKVAAPYMRVGIDFNMLKNKFQNNRLYIGARYGFSTYKYDMSGPAMEDPIWGGSESFSMKDINATSHWAELVFGVEVSIYKNFHMGWAVRYKREIATTKNDSAKPNCIPGYGYTTNSSCWSGTYSLIFDLNWGMKKSRKRGVNVTVGTLPTPDDATEGGLPNAEENTINESATEEQNIVEPATSTNE